MHLLWLPQLYRMHASVARELGNFRSPGQFGTIYVLILEGYPPGMPTLSCLSGIR